MPKATSCRPTHPIRGSTVDRPARPPNAFIIFRSEMIAQLNLKSIIPNQRNVSRVVSYLWNDLPKEHKERYHQEARLRSHQHRLDYPDYQFRRAPTKQRKNKTRKFPREDEVASAHLVANAIKGGSAYSSVTNPSPGSLPTLDNAQQVSLMQLLSASSHELVSLDQSRQGQPNDSQIYSQTLSQFISPEVGGGAHSISDGTASRKWESMPNEQGDGQTLAVGAGENQLLMPETVQTSQLTPVGIPSFEGFPTLDIPSSSPINDFLAQSFPFDDVLTESMPIEHIPIKDLPVESYPIPNLPTFDFLQSNDIPAC